MSILNKTSEFFNATQIRETYLECFKNPTFDEWKEVINNNKFNSARGIIERDGTLYIWDERLIHDKALNTFGIPNSGVHFTLEPRGIELYITYNIDMDFLKSAFYYL